MDSDTGKPIIYDPCAFYGHNEYEIGIQKVAWVSDSLTPRCSVDSGQRISRHIIK